MDWRFICLVNRRGENLSEYGKPILRVDGRAMITKKSRWEIKEEENGRYDFMASFVDLSISFLGPRSSSTPPSPSS